MKRIYILNFLLIVGILLVYFFEYSSFTEESTVNIGVLFSETGSMAKAERPVLRSTLLAIEQINQLGGVNGKRIIPIIYDGASDPKQHAVLAKKMIQKDHVKAIFGCWTSASRKEVKPIVEEYNNLLIYPTQNEGIEDSNNIIYLGAIPNQQLVPAVSWMLENYGKKFFLVGSDYIYPHVANEILAHESMVLGGKIAGTHYIPIGSTDVDAVINDIIQKNPDFIFNTINGSTNTVFFKRLYELTVAKGIRRPPVMSFSLSNGEMYAIGLNKMVGDLATGSYFLSQNNSKNKVFLKDYLQKDGSIDEVSDTAITAYSGVYLWAQAVHESPSIEPTAVREFMLRQSVASPSGVIYIDPTSAHAWRIVEIARVDAKGQNNIVWTSGAPVEPIVYPDFKTKAEWDFFEYELYTKWNKSWGKFGMQR